VTQPAESGHDIIWDTSVGMFDHDVPADPRAAGGTDPEK